MMPNSRFDLAEIARSALSDMPEASRAALLAEILTELRGPQALDHLSKARAAISLRMQELIDDARHHVRRYTAQDGELVES